jgi:hypothetical protein
MSAKISSLLDLEKELRENFVGLRINFGPTEERPEWIEVSEEAWPETKIHINLHPECISMFAMVRGKSDSYNPLPLPTEAQDCLNQIKALLEPSIRVVVHGSVTVGGLNLRVLVRR